MASPRPAWCNFGFWCCIPQRRWGTKRTSHYKFWVLAALLLLTFWSMLAGSVTLRLSAGGLAHWDPTDSASYEDLDISDIEASEKVVMHLWDVYTHSRTIRLPRFWKNAGRGYESLGSDVQIVGDATITEIAKMSLRSTIFMIPLLFSRRFPCPSLTQF